MSDPFDDLDRRLQRLAGDARASVTVPEPETEAALAEVTSGAHVTRLRPVGAPERGGPRTWLAVAAATALVATGGVWLLTRGPEKLTTTEPTVPAAPATEVVSVPPTPPSETLTTTPLTASTAAATSTPSTTTATTEPARPPATTVPVLDLGAALAGLSWEATPIARVCGEVWWEQQQASQERCSDVEIDPQGIPVSFDPVSRVVARERREGDEPVAFTLPDEYVDASLLAAGPDDVVYFTLDNEWPAAADVVAFSLAPGDVGREIERLPRALGIGDADVFPIGRGLVTSGWYSPGLRPSGDEPVAVPWVSRTGDDPPEVPFGAFDDANDVVAANGWQWSVAERTVRGEAPGPTRVVPTFDGGFLALYEETQGELRAELIRGWRDGTVEYAELPVSWFALGGMILEPQGTVLLPNGDRFVRLTPFAERPNGWDGRLEIDVEAGTATAVGLDDYLDTIEWPMEGQSHVWPWGLSPRAFANAVAGPLGSPATLRTVEERPVDATSTVVTITDEGLLDDSVAGTRLTFHLSLDQPGFRIDRIEWANTCQPGRGHQDYQAAYCV